MISAPSAIKKAHAPWRIEKYKSKPVSAIKRVKSNMKKRFRFIEKYIDILNQLNNDNYE